MHSFLRSLWLLTGLVFADATGIKNLYAQQQKVQLKPFFDRITSQQGLSDNYITALHKDSRGFLWIGTNNGLNEYDGRKITVFRHNRFDSNSILSNKINNIIEDDSGYLWLGTNEGVSRFNPFSHRSVNYRHDPKNPFSLNDNYNCHVYFDKYRTLWIGNESGVSYFDRKKKRFIHIQILPDSLNKHTLTSTGSFYEDREGRFWIGTYSGLVLYNRKTHSYKRFVLNPNGGKGDNPVTTIYEDHEGRLWVGFWGYGLNLFDIHTGKFKSYKWNKKEAFPGTVNLVFSLTESRTKKGDYILWAATSEGLIMIDSHSMFSDSTLSFQKSYSIIRPDPKDIHSLSSEKISCLLYDPQNIMWVGTRHGLNEYISRNQHFTDALPYNGYISRIWVDSLHHPLRYFVSSWYGDGLTEFDKDFKPFHVWHRVPENAHNAYNGEISDVLVSKTGLIWIGTFNGLYSYNEKTRSLTAYLHSENDKNSLSSSKITALGESKDGRIWIGTYGKGLNVFDPDTKTFTHYNHQTNDTTSLCDDLIWNIYVDRHDQVWIGANNGFCMFDATKNHFINYYKKEGIENSLSGSSVAGIIEDSNQVYWIATNKGLYRFDKNNNQFTLFATEEGLKNNEMTGLIRDNEGLLWMCDGNNISSFNPATHTFINYDEQNGLPEEAAGVLAMNPSGEILVGGSKSIIRFNPKDFKYASVPPPVYITGIEVSGDPVPLHYREGSLQPLILHYPHNNLSVTFSGPEFFNGKAVKYAYFMKGADEKWNNSGDRDFVSYSGLAPGHYTLSIKAANSDGVWNETGAKLDITVLPPFWKTWWFRALAAAIALILIYGLFIYRVRRIKKAEALKTSINKQMADMRLKVLRTRINPHFMFNALNSIQECIYTQKTDAATKYLSKFSKLLRLILEQSENTFITVSEEIKILRLYLELESLRFDDGFSFEIKENNIESDMLEIPPMLIQPFVENALWHGLRHKSGNKNLWINFSADDHFIKVVIEDNGIGREAAKAFVHARDIKKQSLGIKISEEQLQMVGTLANRKTDFRTEDLFSENGVATGTRVTVTIPILQKT